MNRALHLMIDHVFTRDFIADATKVNNSLHDFLVYGQGISGKSFVAAGPNVTIAAYGSSRYKKILARLGTHYTHLFVHWLSYEAGEAVIAAPKHVKVGAFFWGNDFAEPTTYFCERVFEPLNLAHYRNSSNSRSIKWRNNPRWRYITNPAWVLKTLRQKLAGAHGTAALFEAKKTAIARLDYFLHFNSHDLDWVNIQTPTKAAYVPFFYAAGYEEAAGVEATLTTRPSVVIGNSASMTNNHLDTLTGLLRNANDCELVIPLSYGDARYGAHVTQAGKQLFGESCRPLTTYLSRDDYFKTIGGATSALFNIRRTQAVGNINAMFAMGKNVFINRHCPLYKYYVENGFLIYDIEDAYSGDALVTPLNTHDAVKNKERLTNVFSEKLRMKYLNDILNFISV
ncbi:MAG TPA: TDP-N-acetylfucosamine:lipid II N-acetylfucosaminyltransferase [Chitinophagales bacterium]|nr:TDP-N-acetylfucosamine:lipid II N-acetylfucosaminyltransferase [Chitinophagales bacterium]